MSNSRGYRNNNPGNIRMTKIAWVGKVAAPSNTDGAFEQFVHLKFGVRAMILDVRGKITKGLNTIEKLLAVYAPKNENNTRAYVATVARLSGLKAGQVLNTSKGTLQRLVIAMSQVENGKALTPAQFEEGWAVLSATHADVLNTVKKTASQSSSPLASAESESGSGSQVS